MNDKLDIDKICRMLERSTQKRKSGCLKPSQTEVLEAIRVLWKKNPELRLGQLLWSLYGDDPFYVPDEFWAQISREEL